jgi:pimeloyl-ACP methyl ester carboxylesterase
VGHSYSGIVAAQVAARAADRVAHTVFLEAFLPQDGRSLLDVSGLDVAHEMDLIRKDGGRWPPPDRAELERETGLSSAQREWLLDGFVGHPGRTITDPVRLPRPLSRLRATYIGRRRPEGAGEPDPSIWSSPTWRYLELQAGHWPMVSAPRRLAELLAELDAGAEAYAPGATAG